MQVIVIALLGLCLTLLPACGGGGPATSGTGGGTAGAGGATSGTGGTTSTTSPASCAAQTTANCVLTEANSGSTETGTCAAGYTGSCSYSCIDGIWTQVADTCAPRCAASTIDHCVLTDTNSGSTDNGACASGYSGSCSYACDSGSFTSVVNNCAADCAAGTINNCVLTTTTSGSTDNGACASGTSGSCSYACNNGTFTSVTNTCSPSPCPAGTTSNCVLAQANSGSTETGTCASGYSGSCSYACSNGTFTSVTNTCSAPSCAAGTTNNCVLTQTNSGSTDTGTCAAGYTGTCSFACSLGTWTQVTDTCSPNPCPAGTTNNCVLTQTNSGSTDTGACASGYTGACSFACNLGSWTQVTDTCSPNPCPAGTTNNCVLTQTNSGSTDTGACAAGYSGTCSYSCALGAWTQVANTCAAGFLAHNITDGTNAYMSALLDGTIYKVNESTGVASLLTTTAPTTGFTMAFYGGTLYAGAQGSSSAPTLIYKVNTSTGAFTSFASIPVATSDLFCGMWFDPSGNLYFNISTNTTVYKVTPAGVVSPFISGDGHLLGNDNDTQGTCDGSGNHYIASRYGRIILHYSGTGTYINTLTTNCYPYAIAVAGDGNLLYTCNDANIYKLDLGTLANSTFATLPGAAIGYLSVDPTGSVYAGEFEAETAWKLSSTGATLWSVVLDAPFGVAF